MATNAIVQKQTSLLPRWIVRLLGYSSLAAAILSLIVYWYKRFPPSSGPTTASNSSAGWGTRLLGGVASSRKKRVLTLSLKNTVLWNPSSDVDTPNHAFHENAAIFLNRLTQLFDVHVIIHVSSDDEKDQINQLLQNAGLLEKGVLDTRKILWCSTEEGKIHMIRHIEPAVHIEGGWELDDGEDIVRKLRPFVPRLLWVITRRRRSSFNQARLKESDQGIMGANVELADKLLETSVASEIGFAVVEEDGDV
ncbi:hypothetical protein BDB00DRAFT_768262 [Zychaea mexicana]|uniref:uncharacterized protein n=1 Tax=Zychaea mexicana TaxID=64656 RepID=UPI0022FE8461|nr:uncharacterized protein BDB00DRAFT_768262 [Zychaea mexicana]KAI9490812.1 hypothetical protein BDB00DRAFT_768262 [Zychaea mexicana]